MRTLAFAAVLCLALAASACTKSDEQKAANDTNAAANDMRTSGAQLGNEMKEGAQAVGNDVKDSVQDAGAQVKAVAHDPDVQKAGEEVKSALKDLGASVKKAAKESKERRDAGNTAGNQAG